MYTVHIWDEGFRKNLPFPVPDQVEFSSMSPGNLPLPKPEYLRLHALCAKVAHLSGAAEVVDRVLDCVFEGGEDQVLAEDGSSWDTLNVMLSRSISVI
jgi:hypothetical protein